VKIDSALPSDLRRVPEAIRALEEAGFDGVLSAETSHDPFFPLLIAAEHSQRIGLVTSIAVAFARNPMTLAQLSHDLNAYSEGRFTLGLGSQIKPHITKRFSMPWSKPAARMRELILALRAIWENWYAGTPLHFRGEFYTHTLMTPMFTPTDTQFGRPRISLAAVGPLMTEVAAEVADGVICHAFTTRRYLEQVTLPAVERGLAKSGRSRSDFEIAYPLFVVTGETEEAFAGARRSIRQQIAFYGSTPAYRPVLELHGWGELQTELNRMSKEGKWQAMGELIEDDILTAFAVVAEPAAAVAAIRERVGDLVDRIALSPSFAPPERLPGLLVALRA